MTLARDVFAGPPGTAPLLREGTPLKPEYVRHLIGMNIGSVWVADDLSEGVEVVEPLAPETREHVRAQTGKALVAANKALKAGSGIPAEAIEALSSVIDEMMQDLLDTPDAALALDDLNTFDAYTHRHSVNVAVLGLLIARRHWYWDGWRDYRGVRRYDKIEQRLRKLGLGLLVHDVGKLAVPNAVLNKPGALDEGEWDLVRGHADAGVELLRRADLSPMVVALVREHHERLDGSGYPRGMVGDEINDFARIAAVADVYDAITAERVYRSAQPPHIAVGIINAGRGTLFCPNVVRAFRSIVFPYPVGHEIELPDGSIGVVAAVDPQDPDQPVVRVRRGTAIEEIRVDMREAVAAA